jgi:hypothetical protein
MGENKWHHNSIKCIFLFLILALGPGLYGQAQIDEPAAISRMLNAYAEKNKSQEKVKAWRIQVLATSDRRAIEKEKIRFENLYPYLRLEWIHDNPYYILKIKDVAYGRKMDALHLLHRIKDRYPSAILVLDDVLSVQLLNSPDY